MIDLLLFHILFRVTRIRFSMAQFWQRDSISCRWEINKLLRSACVVERKKVRPYHVVLSTWFDTLRLSWHEATNHRNDCTMRRVRVRDWLSVWLSGFLFVWTLFLAAEVLGPLFRTPLHNPLSPWGTLSTLVAQKDLWRVPNRGITLDFLVRLQNMPSSWRQLSGIREEITTVVKLSWYTGFTDSVK